MNTKILEDLGLTKSEIKVYIALLEIGPHTAGEILKKANIQNSVLHFSINKLLEKGLVTYIKKSNTRIYSAVDPKNLLEYIEDKKEQLKVVIKKIERKKKESAQTHQAEVFEGIRGIQTALYELIKETKPKDHFLFFSANIQEKNEDIQKFYARFDAKRKQKKLQVLGIAPKKLRQYYKKRTNLHVKYVNFPIPENMGLCSNKMVIITWEQEPKAILITSKGIVQKQRDFFMQVWEMAK